MKILWIGHFLPWPPHGGAFQRCYYLLKALSAQHDVHMLTFTQKQLCPTEKIQKEAERELGRLCSGIDVFDREPPETSPLLELDNVVLTPHTAAFTNQALKNMDRGVVEQLIGYARGEKPPFAVNPEVFGR